MRYRRICQYVWKSSVGKLLNSKKGRNSSHHPKSLKSQVSIIDFREAKVATEQRESINLKIKEREMPYKSCREKKLL